MIAEYEGAQILERSRRGKRHRARSGEVSVLSGAPYGYRCVRRTDEVPASHAVIDAEARVVQRVYEMYAVDELSTSPPAVALRCTRSRASPARMAGAKKAAATASPQRRSSNHFDPRSVSSGRSQLRVACH